jgi:hypothetical protein
MNIETQIFILLATIYNLFWAINWSRCGWGNVLCKMIFTCLSLYGIFELLKISGYLIKV